MSTKRYEALSLLSAGHGVCQVANLMNVSRRTVTRWKVRAANISDNGDVHNIMRDCPKSAE